MIELTVMFAMFGAIALGYVWKGFVLTILWGWFMVPTFGLQPLAIAPAIGVSIVVGYLTHQRHQNDGEKGGSLERTAEIFGYMAMMPALALLVGWIVKQWM
jgi:hypothetical protein